MVIAIWFHWRSRFFGFRNRSDTDAGSNRSTGW